MSRHIQRTSSWADWSHTELAKSTLMEESTEQLQFWGRCTWVITLGMWALTKEQCVIVACCQSGVWVVNSSTKETRGRVKGWKGGTYAIIHKAQMTTNMCSCHTSFHSPHGLSCYLEAYHHFPVHCICYVVTYILIMESMFLLAAPLQGRHSGSLHIFDLARILRLMPFLTQAPNLTCWVDHSPAWCWPIIFGVGPLFSTS